jgi:membrane associated rhomboid family serine protease
MSEPLQSEPPRREPLLSLPAVVTALIVVLVAVHLVRTLVLAPMQDGEVVILFAFIPIRYEAIAAGYAFPGGVWAEVWSPLTYGLLHGSWMHLAVNAVWLAVFGTALAARFGAVRFLVFSALATIAGAAAHYAVHPQDIAPVVGASAAISGHMAAAARFVFQTRRPLRGLDRDVTLALARPVPLLGLGRDRRVIGFLVVWLVLNLAVGLGAGPMLGEDTQVAWEAHVGGFLFGLLAFSLFDPPEAARLRRAEAALARLADGHRTA